MKKDIPRDQISKFLRIDPDGLDECLMEQPEVFHHVSEGYALATARRDALKLDFEEAEAEEATQIREKAREAGERATEGSVSHALKLEPRLKKLQRQFLDARTEAELWKALKESFEQRSYMLRELVSLNISQHYSLGLERGAVKDRAEVIRRKAGEERRRRISAGV